MAVASIFMPPLAPPVMPDSFGPWDRPGPLEPASVAAEFGLSLIQLAETAGLSPQALHRTDRAHSQKTQSRLREVLEIVIRATDWAGGPGRALAWYRAQPIPAFGGRTAESLVKEGRASAVRDYLDQIALGGFA
jgi:hypothetical protein